jgi:tetratricopeptide (TPR) repeat protein
VEAILKLIEFFQDSWQWLVANILLGFALFVGLIVVRLYFRVRKSIVFEAWVNRSSETAPELGKSLADLLLHKIRAIQSIHEKSIRKIELWNPYYDIPAFQQGLDEDLQLLASVELGNYGEAISKLITFLFRLVPFVFQPAKLRGSIHSYGKEIYLQVMLENYKPKGAKSRTTRVWETKGEAAAPERFPILLEELAYQIYLELAGTDLYKSWQSFRAYANGLAHYLSYIDIPNDHDFKEAENFYQEAIALEPNNPACFYNLGVLKYFRYEHVENEKAIELFRQALPSSDQRLKGHAHSGLANALSQRHHRFKVPNPDTMPEARFHAEQAIAIAPKLDVANKALAFAYHQSSELENLPKAEADRFRQLAIKHYRKACRKNPKYHIAYNNLGNLYLEWAVKSLHGRERQRTLKRAIDACQHAVDIQPSYHHAYDNIGNAYLALGRLKEAEDHYRIALQYQPEYAEGKNDLAMLYLLKSFTRHDPVQALALHHEAISLPKVTATQREKLCKAFQQRLKADAASLLEKQRPDLRPQLAEARCSCLAAGK